MNEYYRAPGADDDFTKQAEVAKRYQQLRMEQPVDPELQKKQQITRSILTIALHTDQSAPTPKKSKNVTQESREKRRFELSNEIVNMIVLLEDGIRSRTPTEQPYINAYFELIDILDEPFGGPSTIRNFALRKDKPSSIVTINEIYRFFSEFFIPENKKDEAASGKICQLIRSFEYVSENI